MVYENELTAEEISVLRLIDTYRYTTLANIKKDFPHIKMSIDEMISLINRAIRDTKRNVIYFDNKIFWTFSESPENFSNIPIEPSSLSSNVVSKLKKFKQKIPVKTSVMAEEICKLFNECILCNNNPSLQPERKETEFFLERVSSENLYKTFVISPQTGSAKSLSLKVYVSMLKKESSLIILKEVDDIIQFCQDVNSWSKNSSYAKCHYSITENNLQSENYVSRDELQNHRCIVITHSLFKQLKHDKKYEPIKYFRNQQRDLVVIDERISFFKHYAITLDEVREATNAIESEYEYFNNLPPDQKNLLPDEIFDMIYDLYTSFLMFDLRSNSLLKDHMRGSNSNHRYEYLSPVNWRVLETEDGDRRDLEYLKELIDSLLFERMNSDVEFVSSKDCEKTIKEQRQKLKEIFESIVYISNNVSLLDVTTKKITLHSIGEYHNDFSSYVIMDATANINAYYHIASSYLSRKNLKRIKTTVVKQYKNLTFHISMGYAQGRSSIYKNKEKDILHEVKRYLSMAEGILAKKDKLLIIGHKTMIQYLKKYSKDKRIVFTHWGRHIGKNEWSDCNKVFVIGWNFLPTIEHYLILGAASNGFENIYNSFIREYKKTIQTIAIHQIADDLVQGISRGSLRNTIDSDGNCPISDIYILAKHQKDDATNQILNLVTNEFIDAKIVSWTPYDIGTIKKKTKPQGKIDTIIEYVVEKLKTQMSVTTTQIKEELNISNTTFHRLTNDEFEKICLSKNILYGYLDKKTKHFTKMWES